MAKRPESKRLNTTAEVMTALGGLGPVIALTGADYKTVWPWRKAARFPSRYFLVMQFALHRKGFAAPPELWSMVTPAHRRQAVLALLEAAQKETAAA
jgi:hypothetical protein